MLQCSSLFLTALLMASCRRWRLTLPAGIWFLSVTSGTQSPVCSVGSVWCQISAQSKKTNIKSLRAHQQLAWLKSVLDLSIYQFLLVNISPAHIAAGRYSRGLNSLGQQENNCRPQSVRVKELHVDHLECNLIQRDSNEADCWTVWWWEGKI